MKPENFFPATPLPEFLAPPEVSIQDIRLENGAQVIQMMPHLIINPSTAKESGYVLADLHIISARTEACMKCEFASANGHYGVCGKCGCDIESKVRIAGETCPIGNWETGESNPPSLTQMASTFLGSALRWAKGGMQTVTAEQFYSRIEVCKGCEFWEGSGFAGTGRCKKCGCSTQAKLRMATEKCPIDKWGPVTPSSPEQQQPNTN
jgi:hypothetical protein